MTLGRLWERFRERALPNLPSEERRANVRRHLEGMIHGPRGGAGARTPALQLGQDFVDRWARLRTTGKIDAHGRPVPEGEREGKAVRAGTVNYELASLRQLFKWGAEEARRPDGEPLLRFDPLAGMDKIEEKNPLRPVASDEKYRALLDAAREHDVDAGNRRGDAHREPSPLYPLLVLCGECGVRAREACRLRWSDWRPEKGGPHGSIHWRAENQKTGRERTVPVTRLVREALRAWREVEPGIGETWIFPAPRSEGPVRRSTAYDWYKQAEREAGLPHPEGGGFHELRRRWASKRKHLSPEDVALAGGWRDVQTMQRSYQQPDEETVERVVLDPEAQVGGGGG